MTIMTTKPPTELEIIPIRLMVNSFIAWKCWLGVLPYLLADEDLLFDMLELTLYKDLWRGTSDTVAPSGSR